MPLTFLPKPLCTAQPFNTGALSLISSHIFSHTTSSSHTALGQSRRGFNFELCLVLPLRCSLGYFCDQPLALCLYSDIILERRLSQLYHTTEPHLLPSADTCSLLVSLEQNSDPCEQEVWDLSLLSD